MEYRRPPGGGRGAPAGGGLSLSDVPGAGGPGNHLAGAGGGVPGPGPEADAVPHAHAGHGQGRGPDSAGDCGRGDHRRFWGLRRGRHHLHRSADGLSEKLRGQMPALYPPAD